MAAAGVGYGDRLAGSAVVEGDVDDDGSSEIVTGGYYFDGTRDCAQLVVWDGATLGVDGFTAWYWTGDTRIISSLSKRNICRPMNMIS